MKQKRKLLVLLSCAAFCFTLFVFSPGDFLISHQSDFWFTWGDLGLAFFGVFAAGLLVLYACGRIAFRSSLIYSAVMTALALLAYVQGNYINADYGLLDGSVIDWSQYTVYGIITTILWGGVILISIIGAIKKPKTMSSIVKVVCLGLIGIQALSLVLLGITTPTTAADENADDGQYVLSTEGMFDYSSESNVIVFLADAFDSDLFTKLLIEKPELFASWDGFEYFPDFAGSYSKTTMSIPYILTGVEYENEMSIAEYEQTICSDVPFLNALEENGYDIGLYTWRDCFTQASNSHTISNIRRTDAFCINDFAGLLKEYFKLTTFRYAPHVLKSYLVTDTAVFSKFKGVVGDNIEVYKDAENFDFLRYRDENEITTKNNKKTFRFYHVTGAHYPATMDENLNRVDQNSISIYQQAKGVVKYFNDFIEELKTKGLYDSATIIFTADHGHSNDGVVVYPSFALKLPNATGAIKANSRPLWQKDIRNIILNAVGIEPLEDSIGDPLNSDDVYTRTRYFYRYSGEAATRLPDLEVFEIKTGSIAVNTGKVLKQDGTIEEYESPTTVQVGTYLNNNELYSYSEGFSEDHWTLGSSTSFAIPLEAVDHDLYITLPVYLWKDGVDKVIVSTPSGVVGEFDKESSQTGSSFEISFTVPQTDIGEDNTLYLRLTYPSLPYPALGPGDARRTGLHITGMEIR